MKTLAVKTIRSDLEAGTPDEKIMEKYELSPSELRALFDALIRAMAMGASIVKIET